MEHRASSTTPGSQRNLLLSGLIASIASSQSMGLPHHLYNERRQHIYLSPILTIGYSLRPRYDIVREYPVRYSRVLFFPSFSPLCVSYHHASLFFLLILFSSLLFFNTKSLFIDFASPFFYVSRTSLPHQTHSRKFLDVCVVFPLSLYICVVAQY